MKKKIIVGFCAISSLLILTGCNTPNSSNQSSTSNSSITNNVEQKPQQIIPTPKNLQSITSPSSNGYMYLIAGTPSSKGLYKLQLSDGSQNNSISISNHAIGLARNSTGQLAYGEATSSTGAVDIVNTSTLKKIATIPVGAPVKDITVNPNGQTSFYVLNGNSHSESVSIISTHQKAITKNIPVSLGTIAIATDGSTLYCLESNGDIEGISIQTMKPQFQFKAVNNPISLVLSPGGNHLYILKKAGSNRNVSVINVQTESQTKALPAPKGANSIAINPDGSLIYVGADDNGISNVQSFSTR
ncbi:YncE family protein [Alicyclobacillus tolerans]|uniref:DNA-binding beta-propeller fold protein YncE n=1 Tax=Alicyclobacillus tolerans TaxID=90970 RepID=A0ABT9LZ61_9BACL|nr:YncE family protein [Alicyclobacillus tengchongensis]MDP9729555.1 DNA-binding beta-propeller fold protein YncE [Alicyclobacillus tengchongensis]